MPHLKSAQNIKQWQEKTPVITKDSEQSLKSFRDRCDESRLMFEQLVGKPEDMGVILGFVAPYWM